MRRNAICLFVPLLVIIAGLGCRHADKNNADAQTAEAFYQPYTPTPYSEPAQEYEPYAVDPAPAERSASTLLASAGATGSATYHTVMKSDTLYGLARTYYGNAARWKDIYEANRDELADPNKIFVGQQLLIP